MEESPLLPPLPYTCAECRQQFTLKPSLTRHWLQTHLPPHTLPTQSQNCMTGPPLTKSCLPTNELPPTPTPTENFLSATLAECLSCPLCGATSPNLPAARAHSSTHGSGAAARLDVSLSRLTARRLDQLPDTESYVCPWCPMVHFPCRPALTKHVVCEHLQIPVFQCGACQFRGTSRESVLTHARRAHESTAAPCTVREHFGEVLDRWSPPSLHRQLEKVAHLRMNKHFSEMHPGQTPPEIDISCTTEEGTSHYSHVVVDKLFHHFQREHRHLLACKLCGQDVVGKTFTNSYHLELANKQLLINSCYAELEKLEKSKYKHRCEYCGRNFTNSKLRKYHVLIVHLKIERFGCLECERKSFSMQWMVRHYAKNHPGVRVRPRNIDPLPRELYERFFLTQQQQRKKWRKPKGTKRGVWQCEVCDRVFLLQRVYQLHAAQCAPHGFKCLACHLVCGTEPEIRSHLQKTHFTPGGKRAKYHSSPALALYCCAQCGHSDNDFTSYTKHLEKCWIPTYTCKMCPFKGVNSRGFILHVRYKHGVVLNDPQVDTVECANCKASFSVGRRDPGSRYRAHLGGSQCFVPVYWCARCQFTTNDIKVACMHIENCAHSGERGGEGGEEFVDCFTMIKPDPLVADTPVKIENNLETDTQEFGTENWTPSYSDSLGEVGVKVEPVGSEVEEFGVDIKLERLTPPPICEDVDPHLSEPCKKHKISHTAAPTASSFTPKRKRRLQIPASQMAVSLTPRDITILQDIELPAAGAPFVVQQPAPVTTTRVTRGVPPRDPAQPHQHCTLLASATDTTQTTIQTLKLTSKLNPTPNYLPQTSTPNNLPKEKFVRTPWLTLTRSFSEPRTYGSNKTITNLASPIITCTRRLVKISPTNTRHPLN